MLTVIAPAQSQSKLTFCSSYITVDGEFGELSQLLTRTAKIKQSHFQHDLESANEHLDVQSIPEALSHLNHRDAGTYSPWSHTRGHRHFTHLTTLTYS